MRFFLRLFTFLILSTGTSNAYASICKSLFLRSTVELPAKAKRFIEETEKGLEKTNFTPDLSLKKQILSEVSDKNIKRGISKAFDAIHTGEFIIELIVTVQLRAFELMLTSGNQNLIAQAKNGILDYESVTKALLEEAKRDGVKTVKIKKALSSQDFQTKVGEAYVIDSFFASQNGFHGAYTHFIQQVSSFRIIAEESGLSLKKVFKFFGTTGDGQGVWINMYDNYRPWHGPVTPSVFRKYYIEPYLPL